LHLHLFNFLYRVRDLRPRCSTRRRTVFRTPSIPFNSQVIGPTQYDESLNYGIVKSTNARKCMKVYNKHNIPPTYLGLSCDYPQGGELQRMDTSRYYKLCIILRAFVVSLQYLIAHCKVMEHLKLLMKCLISL